MTPPVESILTYQLGAAGRSLVHLSFSTNISFTDLQSAPNLRSLTLKLGGEKEAHLSDSQAALDTIPVGIARELTQLNVAVDDFTDSCLATNEAFDAFVGPITMMQNLEELRIRCDSMYSYSYPLPISRFVEFMEKLPCRESLRAFQVPIYGWNIGAVMKGLGLLPNLKEVRLDVVGIVAKKERISLRAFLKGRGVTKSKLDWCGPKYDRDQNVRIWGGLFPDAEWDTDEEIDVVENSFELMRGYWEFGPGGESSEEDKSSDEGLEDGGEGSDVDSVSYMGSEDGSVSSVDQDKAQGESEDGAGSSDEDDESEGESGDSGEGIGWPHTSHQHDAPPHAHYRQRQHQP
ncbi:hypothetical protein HDV00_008175 [Rhizophlyctis rosea]|nr:hypothetical protein HDV00_008175 [Rhizophlyctis rosea]